VSLCLVMLMSFCTSGASLEIESQTRCDELKADFPSVSRQDTQQTKEEFSRFLKTFEVVCGAI
jgi:hypothetical protein